MDAIFDKSTEQLRFRGAARLLLLELYGQGTLFPGPENEASARFYALIEGESDGRGLTAPLQQVRDELQELVPGATRLFPALDRLQRVIEAASKNGWTDITDTDREFAIGGLEIILGGIRRYLAALAADNELLRAA